jgi:hypothetical protein
MGQELQVVKPGGGALARPSADAGGEMDVFRLDDAGCEIAFFDRGQQLVPTSVFTMEDAKRSEVLSGGNKKNWEKFPRNMLFARALSNGARRHCPDIFGGPAYTPEELGAQVDAEGAAVGVAPPVQPTAPGGAVEVVSAAELAGAFDPGGDPDTLKGRVRDLCSAMNKAGHPPKWTDVTLKLYIKEWYMAEGLDAMSVRDLQKLVADFEKKLAALKDEDQAERSLAGGGARSAVKRAAEAQEGAQS